MAKRPASEIYEKLSPRDHVLHRPDTYIGAVQPVVGEHWIANGDSFEQKSITFVEGLYKIFDEVLVNAADNRQRDSGTTEIKISVTADQITIRNNGKSIPIELHDTHGCYIPELVFGHLLTSSNFNDDEKRTTGGRNGLGSKVAAIFSTEFAVTVFNGGEPGKIYTQTFRNNLATITPPSVKKRAGKKDWLQVSFKPDLRRFGVDCISDDMIALFHRRAYDIAGVFPGLRVWFNGTKIALKSFRAYCELYGVSGLVSEKINGTWEIAVGVASQPLHVSFVNAIATTRGGTHVRYVTTQLVNKILKKLPSRDTVSSPRLRSILVVFVNSLVVNPTFDSQTKTTLTTPSSVFGPKPEPTDKLVGALLKSTQFRQQLDQLTGKVSLHELKSTDGVKRRTILGIPKLEDAIEAGGRNSRKCSLILTEGDSAKAFAVAGLEVVGRKHYGVFPLKGKPLNVRDASSAVVAKNVEITNLKKILGLQNGVVYTDTKRLRYGSVIICADVDYDGFHIKGLIANVFDTFWPSLLKIPGFLKFFVTPIVKCTRGSQTRLFYSLNEFRAFSTAGWQTIFLKGLGSSTPADARTYFSDLPRHLKTFQGEPSAHLKLAFDKKGADARKQWLTTYDPDEVLDSVAPSMTYDTFVNKELIGFSVASNERAIPSVVDGLKPSTRKILYTFRDQCIFDNTKVSACAGLVTQHAAYHHGEASLHQAIIGLAQDFVGSNNINLLMPEGQFGTRFSGKDAASPRYIFTKLNPTVHYLFPSVDHPILRYLQDDGKSVEPQYYVPVLPFVLVNGTIGIGTGHSTSIPSYNPRDLLAAVRGRLSSQPWPELTPWYRGWTGQVVKTSPTTYELRGVWNRIDGGIQVTELPVGRWTYDFKVLLEKLVEAKTVDSFEEYSTNQFKIMTVLQDEEEIVKTFKLTTTVRVTNMNLFSSERRLKKYNSVQEILEEHFQVRLAHYTKRKAYLIQELEGKLRRITNRARFIQGVINETIHVRNVPRSTIVEQLTAQEFTDHANLLRLPIYSLTAEKVAELQQEQEAIRRELEATRIKTEVDLYTEDLEQLEGHL